MIPIIQIIFAFALPIYVIWKRESKAVRRPYVFSVVSFCCCGWGLVDEILTLRRRLFNGDIAGIEDTISAVVIICIVMLAITLVLNFIMLGLSYEK